MLCTPKREKKIEESQESHTGKSSKTNLILHLYFNLTEKFTAYTWLDYNTSKVKAKQKLRNHWKLGITIRWYLAIIYKFLLR